MINHPEFEWQAFEGNIRIEGELIHVKLLDSFRKCVYLAPFGLWLTLDAALFEEVEFNSYEIHEPNPGPIRNTVMEYKGGPNPRIIDFVLKRD